MRLAIFVLTSLALLMAFFVFETQEPQSISVHPQQATAEELSGQQPPTKVMPESQELNGDPKPENPTTTTQPASRPQQELPKKKPRLKAQPQIDVTFDCRGFADSYFAAPLELHFLMRGQNDLILPLTARHGHEQSFVLPKDTHMVRVVSLNDTLTARILEDAATLKKSIASAKIRVSLTIKVSIRHTIRGRLTGPKDLKAVAGLKIVFYALGQQSGGMTITTAKSDGSFELPLLSGGTYALELNSVDFALNSADALALYETRSHREVARAVNEDCIYLAKSAQSFLLSVSGQNDLDKFVIPVLECVDLKVRCVDSSDQPVIGAYVSMGRLEDGKRTDAKGYCRLPNVRQSMARLRVAMSGRPIATLAMIDLVADRRREFVLRLLASRDVTVRVVNEQLKPLPGVEVALENGMDLRFQRHFPRAESAQFLAPFSETALRQVTDFQGECVFENINISEPAFAVELSAKSGLIPINPRWGMITSPLEELPATILFKVGRGFSYSGRVVDNAEKCFEWAELRFSKTSTAMANTRDDLIVRADTLGRFQFNAPDAGPYFLRSGRFMRNISAAAKSKVRIASLSLGAELRPGEDSPPIHVHSKLE